MTNFLLNPSFETDSNSDGVADNWTLYNTTGQSVAQLSAGGLYGNNAQRSVLTAGAPNSSYFQYVQNSPVGSFSAGDPATFSIWVKGSSNRLVTSMLIYAFTSLGGSLGAVSTSVTALTSTWTRWSVTYSPLPANTSFCRVMWQDAAISTTEVNDYMLDGAKLEKSATPTDFLESVQSYHHFANGFNSGINGGIQ